MHEEKIKVKYPDGEKVSKIKLIWTCFCGPSRKNDNLCVRILMLLIISRMKASLVDQFFVPCQTLFDLLRNRKKLNNISTFISFLII